MALVSLKNKFSGLAVPEFEAAARFADSGDEDEDDAEDEPNEEDSGDVMSRSWFGRPMGATLVTGGGANKVSFVFKSLLVKTTLVVVEAAAAAFASLNALKFLFWNKC